MICKKCGFPNKSEARFCKKCGEHIIAESNVSDVVMPEKKAVIKSHSHRWKLVLIIIGIICGLLITFSVVFALVYLPIMRENKKDALEKQKQEEATKEKAREDTRQASNTKFRNLCLSNANDAYWEYMKLNGTEKADGTVWAENEYWDRAEKNKKSAEDNCYKKYPTK